MSATATSTAIIANPAVGSSALRIVLFGMPDAGKSSLLGALMQSAQIQDKILQGRLVDAAHGLAELQRRLYDDRQQETRQEIIPYPIVFEPYGGSARLDAVIYDCDGRVANELLAQKKSLVDDAKTGSLAQAVLSADALILTIDASATNEQIENDFREFVRFLRLLETHRSHVRSVGGLPVYLVLSKCDLLARQSISRTEWEARIEARRKQVLDRFARYLEGNAASDSTLLSFGSLELHVAPTAARRPELMEASAHPREPFGVAELFRDCFRSANEFRRRFDAANRQLKWVLAGVGGFMAVAATVALFLISTGGPVEQPLALIERVEQFQRNEKPLPDRLNYDVLQRRYDELSALRRDPGFDSLPESKKNYLRSQLDELDAYQAFVERLSGIPFPERAQSLTYLDKIDKDLLNQAAPPVAYEKDWEKTQAVLERQRRMQESQLIRTGVEELRTFFALLKTRADSYLFEKDFHAKWKQQVDALFEQEKKPPFPRDMSIRGAAYAFDETKLNAEKEWLRSRLKLATMRDLASALGVIGDGTGATLEFSATGSGSDLNHFAAVRLEQLRQLYPASGKWDLATLPDPLQTELRKKVQRSADQLTLYGQQAILARMRQGKPAGEDTPRDWKEIADWLISPSLREARELFAFVAHLLDPTAKDPISAAAEFLHEPQDASHRTGSQKPSFEIDIKALTLTIPNNLPQGPFIPGEELYVFLRPQGATATRQTLTLRIDRSATVEGVRDKQYHYKLTDREGVLRFKPFDEFGAELNLKKGEKVWQFIWSNARTSSYAFESLKNAPLVTAGGSSERGTQADGVTLAIEGKFPSVPALLPDVRPYKK